MDIKPHSIKKHRALGYYLAIVKDVISSKKSPFNNLYYVDLYCGDGECDVEQTDEHYDPPIIHSILKPAKIKKLPLVCFINDSNKDNIQKMQEKTKDYKEFIAEYNNEDANTYYQKVLQKIPPDQFSIFFLDPCNHEDLKWTTIEGISRHKHNYRVRFYGDQVRRPELIINLMTYTMLQSYRAKSYQSITESLGTNEWQKKIKENQKMLIDAPIEKAFIQTFIEQLIKIGYKVASPLPILGTQTNNLIYCLIWATNERGYQIIEKRLTSYLYKLLDETQKDNEIAISKVSAKRDHIVPLDKFF